jgi:hypothetical protein
MIIGPYDAIRIYTSNKFRSINDHVHKLASLAMEQEPNKKYKTSKISKKQISVLHGIHSEYFLYYTIFPMIQDVGIQIITNTNICFLRVRTDYSIRISDCGKQCTRYPQNIQYIEYILQRKCNRPLDRTVPKIPYLICPPVKQLVPPDNKTNNHNRSLLPEPMYQQVSLLHDSDQQQEQRQQPKLRWESCPWEF